MVKSASRFAKAVRTVFVMLTTARVLVFTPAAGGVAVAEIASPKSSVVVPAGTNVFTVGIIVCMKMGFATTIGGTDAGSLNLGCDALKQRILENVVDEGRVKGGSIGIIRGRQ